MWSAVELFSHWHPHTDQKADERQPQNPKCFPKTKWKFSDKCIWFQLCVRKKILMRSMELYWKVGNGQRGSWEGASKLLWPQCRSWHLALMNRIQLASAHGSMLSRSLCRVFLPSSWSTFPLSLVSSALDPLIQIIEKILNVIGPNTEYQGMQLVTSHQWI